MASLTIKEGGRRLDSSIFFGVLLIFIGLMTVNFISASIPDDCPSGLVNYWKFDDSPNMGENNPGSGNGANNGATWLESGIVEGAMSFNGNNALIDTAAPINIRGSLTVSAWIYMTSNPYLSCIAGKWYESENKRSWELCTYGGYGSEPMLLPYFSSTGGPLCQPGQCGNIDCYSNNGNNLSNCKFSMNSWHHVAMTFDSTNGNSSSYLDGKLQASQLQPFTNLFISDKNVQIGYSSIGGRTDTHFPGIIDEVAVFNRTLSEDEIERMYNLGEDGYDYCPGTFQRTLFWFKSLFR